MNIFKKKEDEPGNEHVKINENTESSRRKRKRGSVEASTESSDEEPSNYLYRGEPEKKSSIEISEREAEGMDK